MEKEFNFDYEGQTWGSGMVDIREKSMSSLRLIYFLEDMKRFDVDLNNKKILEVGCGEGRNIKAIKDRYPNSDCYGIDISSSAIDRANRDGKEVSFKNSRAEKIPFEDDYFDIVLVFDVLEHIKDEGSFLTEIKRVLRLDGYFHLNLPCEKDPFCLWRYLKIIGIGGNLKRDYAGHINDFTRERAFELLYEYGFKIKNNKYSFHLLGQLLDIAMFSSMYFSEKLLGKRINSNEIITNEENKKISIAKFLEYLCYKESCLFSNLSGMSIHATLLNKKKDL